MIQSKKRRRIHIKLLEESLVRKKRRTNKIQRNRSVLRNNIGDGLREARLSKIKQKSPVNQIPNLEIVVNTTFAFFENPENVINTVRRLDKLKSIRRKTRVCINLSAIREIDIGAISFLLAKIHELSFNKYVKIWGTIPTNQECKQIFYESGFLEYMTNLSGEKYKTESENFIVNVGNELTRNQTVGKTIEKSIEHLTGAKAKYPPVYSIIQEICSNSVEWANPKKSRNTNWFLGVNYCDVGNRSVTFIMTDIGFGIVNTLNRKFKTIIDNLQLVSKIDVLNRAFDRKYGSKSGERNRNRGLPLIKDRFLKKYITKLIVITNDVFLDFENENNSRLLNKELPGTFYCWKIDLNCLEKWKETANY